MVENYLGEDEKLSRTLVGVNPKRSSDRRRVEAGPGSRSSPGRDRKPWTHVGYHAEVDYELRLEERCR